MANKISIMIIDDNRIDLFIHHELIKQMDIANSVTEYAFATEAILFLEKNDIDNWPHLILLDIHMPIMTGFEFLERYAKLPLLCREKCQIIVVSSSLDTGDKQKSKENPFVLELIEKLRIYIENGE